MRWRSSAFALFFCASTPACAEVFTDWKTTDTQRQAIYSTLLVLDWAQTRYIATHPQQYYEKNNAIGRHPSLGDVNRYFLTLGALHYTAVALLPAPYRSWFQTSTIYIEASAVQGNYEIGIGFNF